LILANPKLSADMKRIWKQKLNQLAVDEDEYNERVKKLYENIQPWKTF
jgi:ethanolamine utilization protein EutA (predicted chaperonin)